MLLEIAAREIRARIIFVERQKYDLNSPINPYLNKEVTMGLFMRFASKTSTLTHGWVGQVDDFSFC